MEQTNINERKARLNKMQARYDRLDKQRYKLFSQGYDRYERLSEIRDNIIKVEMELYSSQNEHIDTIWNLCNKLRELIHSENRQSKKFDENVRKQNKYQTEGLKIYHKLQTYK